MKSLFVITMISFFASCGGANPQLAETESSSVSEGIAENTDQELNPLEAAARQQQALQTPSIIGVWEMTLNSPRGSQNGKLSFTEKNGKIVGTNDKGSSFEVQQEGDHYSWYGKNKTPMGSVSAKFNAEVSGDSMKGTVEMTSGRMAGRTMDFTAKRK